MSAPAVVPSALAIPPDEDDDVIVKRLARLEKFAANCDPVLWDRLAPHVFVKGERIHSKLPRHAGLVFTIDDIQVVGDGPLFRCLHPNGEDVHLFREREVKLATMEMLQP